MRVWLRKPNFAHFPAHWLGTLIAAGQVIEGGPLPYVGFVHAEVCDEYTHFVYSAEADGVGRFNDVEIIESYTSDGSEIWAYRVVPDLTEDEYLAVRDWLEGQRGKPYDWAGVVINALYGLAHAVGIALPNPISTILAQLPVIDLAGLRAFSCSKLIGAMLNRFRGTSINLVTFNPCDVASLVEGGLLAELGKVGMHSDPVTGPPQ